MEEGLQKASLLKRFSAGLLDFIAVSIIATLFIWTISFLSGYDRWNDSLYAHYDKYESQYGIKFTITQEEYASYDDETRNRYDSAYSALISDSDAMKAYRMVTNLILLSLSLGIFIAVLIWHFVIPLFTKDGRTLGKIFFGLGVMRRNSVRMNHIALFIRAILGIYTIETMVPVLIITLIVMNSIGIVGPLVLLGLLLLEIALLSFTRCRQTIHCIISDTVVVDYGSQKIYGSEEELLEEKKEKARIRAERDPYYN